MNRIFLAAALCLAVLSTRASAQHEAPAHEATAHGAAGATAHEEQPPLLPSNAEEFKEHTLAPAIWTLVIFIIMLAILYPTAWKQVLAGLKAREQRIRGDIADAEESRKRAEATLAEYNQRLATAEQQVRDLMTKAAADAEKIATNVRMQAQKDAEEIKERSSREIDAASKQAIAEFREYAATVATNAAEQILRRNLNADDQRDLVNRSLDQLQTVQS